VPLEVAAKEPRQAAPIRAHGSAREAEAVVDKGRDRNGRSGDEQ
jgi:hypothetical protein